MITGNAGINNRYNCDNYYWAIIYHHDLQHRRGQKHYCIHFHNAIVEKRRILKISWHYFETIQTFFFSKSYLKLSRFDILLLKPCPMKVFKVIIYNCAYKIIEIHTRGFFYGRQSRIYYNVRLCDPSNVFDVKGL